MGWEYLWILALVAAVLCAVGYYKFVYFLSIGSMSKHLLLPFLKSLCF